MDVLPLPVYIHMRNECIDMDEDLSMMERLTPMRIFGRILEIHDDELISFRWAKDTRDLQEFQSLMNEYYSKEEVLPNTELSVGKTYVIRLEDTFYRCQVSNPSTVNKVVVNLIDHGKSMEVEAADFYYYHHHTLDFWDTEMERFAFVGTCRIADKNQCMQLGIPSLDQFVPDEEVEIFLLSSQEPYYAVVSSLRNPEAKLMETTLINDLLPEFAEAWDEITGNHLELVPAERPTLSLSPKWIHGINPVLVTVPHIESLDKVAICDLLCSLRACILSDYLRENYQKPNVRQSLSVTDPFAQIGVGVIVVALDTESNRYYRARVTEVNAAFTFFDLVGIDFPQWKSFNHRMNDIWLLSKTLEILPRMHHFVPVQRDIPFAFDVELLMTEIAELFCKPHSVALLQYNQATLEPEIVVSDRHNTPNYLHKLLPYENTRTSGFSESAISRDMVKPSKIVKKDWVNKSKKLPNAFSLRDDKKKTNPAEEKNVGDEGNAITVE